uniref:hypothetical protein n=1 Tax=Paramecium gigas TaxID=2709424 RepID=UPI001D0157EE|nr:hypothetical protein LI418_mgp12 [Paramecium gigas]QVG61502.1 hypothetical protein Pgigas_00018 [Paramecium gigas]
MYLYLYYVCFFGVLFYILLENDYILFLFIVVPPLRNFAIFFILHLAYLFFDLFFTTYPEVYTFLCFRLQEYWFLFK